MADRLQIKLAAALLEKIFETLSEEIHHHHVVLFTFVCFLIADVVEAGYAGLSSKLVD